MTKERRKELNTKYKIPTRGKGSISRMMEVIDELDFRITGLEK